MIDGTPEIDNVPEGDGRDGKTVPPIIGVDPDPTRLSALRSTARFFQVAEDHRAHMILQHAPLN